MAQLNQKKVVSISTGTIIRALAIVLVLFFLWLVRDIVVVVIFSLIFASAFDPIVDRLQKIKIPRPISVIFIYLVLVGAIAGIITLLVPPIAEQIDALAVTLPAYFGNNADLFQRLQSLAAEVELADAARNLLTSIGQTLGSNTGGLFATVSGFLGGAFSVVAIAVLTFYLTVEENGVKKFFEFLAPVKQRPYITDLVSRIQIKLGAWLRSYLLLSLIVSVLIYIGLSLFGVEYALVLAILAGLLEFIPFIGPIVASIPAIFLAVTQNPLLGLLVLILYLVVNQFEGHVLVPRILHRAIGLNPVVVVIVLLIGAKLAGFIGVLLAVPLTIALVEFGRDVFEHGKFSSGRLSNAAASARARSRKS